MHLIPSSMSFLPAEHLHTCVCNHWRACGIRRYLGYPWTKPRPCSLLEAPPRRCRRMKGRGGWDGPPFPEVACNQYLRPSCMRGTGTLVQRTFAAMDAVFVSAKFGTAPAAVSPNIPHYLRHLTPRRPSQAPPAAATSMFTRRVRPHGAPTANANTSKWHGSAGHSDGRPASPFQPRQQWVCWLGDSPFRFSCC